MLSTIEAGARDKTVPPLEALPNNLRYNNLPPPPAQTAWRSA